MIVVAFRILPPEVYTLPRCGTFNLHASLLPKYRGAAPIQWAVINGERETGVTTFFLEQKVDTGNILLQARLPIGPDETSGDLYEKLADVGAEIVLHTTRLIEQGRAVPRPQDPAQATPAPKIFRDDCRIDWHKSAGDVHNFIRGLSPRPCAFTYHRGIKLKIYRSQMMASDHTSPPGTVLAAGKIFTVAAAQGIVSLLHIQQEGRKALPAGEFLRGYTVTPGDLLQ